MARTKTTKTSIIKTRSQSRTGTNVRTNDDTIAPAPAGRTIDLLTLKNPPPAVVTTNERTTDPVLVTDDLFAGRPKTGALKDPPSYPSRSRFG